MWILLFKEDLVNNAKEPDCGSFQLMELLPYLYGGPTLTGSIVLLWKHPGW